MTILDTTAIALESIGRNKGRAFLTMLGIIIGVGSVVLLTSIGTGLQNYVEQQFQTLGSNTLYVVPGNPFGEGGGFGNQEQAIIESTKHNNFSNKKLHRIACGVFWIRGMLKKD